MLPAKSGEFYAIEKARRDMSSACDQDRASFALLSLKQALHGESAPNVDPQLHSVYQDIGNWIGSYLMSAHPDLGRSGDVCPFTAQASRINTIRIGVSGATGADIADIASDMRNCCRQLQAIPCPATMRHFRTIIVGFPNVRDEQGLESLMAAQTQLKLYTLMRGLMIGRFHETSDDPGLWNPDFRPLRSPIPLLAIRHLVEHDAPFVIAHPLLIPTYLAKFPMSAPGRLLATLARRRAAA
jgi:hypothetical protein